LLGLICIWWRMVDGGWWRRCGSFYRVLRLSMEYCTVGWLFSPCLDALGLAHIYGRINRLSCGSCDDYIKKPLAPACSSIAVSVLPSLSSLQLYFVAEERPVKMNICLVYSRVSRKCHWQKRWRQCLPYEAIPLFKEVVHRELIVATKAHALNPPRRIKKSLRWGPFHMW